MSAVPEVPVHVYKFGGTSVATAERIGRVVELVQAEPAGARRVVVVSALGGVTDRLLQAIDEALVRSDAYHSTLDAVWQRHAEALAALVPADEQAALRSRLRARFDEMVELLDGVFLLQECTPRTRDAIIGTGERLSAPLVAAAFRRAGADAVALDAARLIRTDAAFGEANVQFDQTQILAREHILELPARQIAVVTGFIASTEQGVLTTLGRSGSDYTATILAGVLGAEQVVIWTDVSGVLSADPRLVPEAFPLPQLSYREAAEMAHFGAKVLHPRTMRPLLERRIPLQIKNTLEPEAPGTWITVEATQADGHVKAVTAIYGVSVVMIEGTGMVGVPGIAARIFAALAARGINVLLISQASSEQSICLGVRSVDAPAAVEALRAALEMELFRRDVTRIYALEDCAVVSVVGDQMREQPGLAGHMFSTLGRNGINVLAIAQGAAETNISAVIHERDVRQAVRSLHEAFALAHDRAHVFLLGTGVVGSALLGILQEQAGLLLEHMHLKLKLIGLSNTRRMLWAPDGVPFDGADAALDEQGQEADFETLVERLTHCGLERLVVVDATASDEVARAYPRLLEHGVSIVTPNKRGNTFEYAFHEQLRQTARFHRVGYFYETTVGAALPVISTLRDLLYAGDRIHRIEGIFSGTLAFVFNSLADGTPFSEAVREARRLGYTEPDPRDDLKGEDVARKLMILAREMEIPVERAEVEVEKLVPEHLLDASVDEFMERLEEADDAWRARVEAARAEGGRLQYIGRIEDGTLQVALRVVPPDAPFHGLRGTANMVVFTTAHYPAENPLVVQGPGAGPVVTASGVLSDLIKAVRTVG